MKIKTNVRAGTTSRCGGTRCGGSTRCGGGGGYYDYDSPQLVSSY